MIDAVLVTGDTYPHRRELARLGGRWSRDRAGYLFGTDQLSVVLNAWAELDGLSYANVEKWTRPSLPRRPTRTSGLPGQSVTSAGLPATMHGLKGGSARATR